MQAIKPVMGLRACLYRRACRPTRVGRGEDALLESRPILGREVGPPVADRIEKVALLLRVPEHVVGEPEQDVGRLPGRNDQLARRPDAQAPEDILVVRWPSGDLAEGTLGRDLNQPLHQLKEQRDRPGQPIAVVSDRRGAIVGPRCLQIDIVMAGDLGLERACEVEVLAEARNCISQLLVGHGQQLVGMRIIDIVGSERIETVAASPGKRMKRVELAVDLESGPEQNRIVAHARF